jgi:hypothetical protein
LRVTLDRLVIGEKRDRVVALDGDTGFVEVEEGFILGENRQGQSDRQQQQ